MPALGHIGIILLLSLMFTPRVHAYQQIDFVREIGQLGKQAEQQRQLTAPKAVAAFGERLYFADTDAHRITVLDQTGKTVLSWGMRGNKPGQFRRPSGIAIDEQGRVFVSDTGNNRIQVFTADGKWLRTFGNKGDGPREFSNPMGIAIAKGLIYVADSDNNRVQIMTNDGIFLQQITMKTKAEEMRSPTGVALDAQNRVYVLDAEGNNVRIFDSAGVQIRVFGSRGSGMEGFHKPQGIAVDSRGFIYVADTGNYKIKKFGPTGKLIGSIGSEGDGHGQFREVVGVLVDTERKIWALDAGKNTIQIFTNEHDDYPVLASASPLPTVEVSKEIQSESVSIVINKRPWGLMGDSLVELGSPSGGRIISSRGSEPGFLKNPRGMAFDGQGNFWIADTGNDRLQKFSPEGSLLQVIGKSGSGEGEFNTPSGVAVSPKGNICVADTGNNRVQVFSPKGVFLGAFGRGGKSSGKFSEIVDIATDGSENIYVVDRGNDRIVKTDSNGSYLWETGKTGRQDGEFKGPENIVVSPDGEIFVIDAGNTRIQVFDSNGQFLRKFGSEGTGPGEFKMPQGLALEDGLRLYVGDHATKRVQIFLVKYTPEVPKEVTAQAKINEVQLNWKASTATYLQNYKIYRADSTADTYTCIGTSTAAFYLDKNLPSDHTYYYRLSSLAKEGNESALSGIVTAITPKLIPAQPKKIRIEASEKQVTLSWLPNAEPFVAQYRVYRSKQPATGFELVMKTDKTIVVDSPLVDETLYYYQVTAIGKEGDEGQPSELVYASTPKAPLTVPPIEISKIELDEIFAAAYKYYESHPLGKAVVINHTERTYSKVKVSFSIKDYMDYPTEMEIPVLAPKESVELQLKPVFSNNILEVSENTPVQSELVLTYHVAGEPKIVKRSFPVMLYEKHAIRWDQKAKVGAFVTAKDPIVNDFTRAVIQQYVDIYPNLEKSIVYARAIYASLGVLGLSYIVDPTPFQEFSESATIVDYTLYPRDVLVRKSGDCDALSMLFAAALENISIETALIDVPGHVFIMFNTGIIEQDRRTIGFPDEMLVLYHGTAWIPLEMTMVGSSFTLAWQKGAEEYYDWLAKGKLDIISIHKAWELFRPVTQPPPTDILSIDRVKRQDIEEKYKGEIEALARQRLVNLSAGYLEVLKKNANDMEALGQLGILYGENGLTSEALEQFQKMLAQDKTNALALNNIGNISYLQGRFDDAREAYEAALKSTPEEPGVMVNLARVLLQSGNKDGAKQQLQKAVAIDPRVVRQYADLAISLGVRYTDLK
ncbi:MAG TPA: 6-bladed beta-propeller [Nitrospirota bacterium]|nr:6-bladed beta-propeller [Nitrospirota bacterium]